MARATKYEIATLIESLPGNTPWSAPSLATNYTDIYTRAEMVSWYNRLIIERKLGLPCIS
jgi:hypothetical protein